MCQVPARLAATLCSARIDDTSSSTAVAAIEPSSELLTRAQAGWERFLATFKGASDE